jgi:1-acyl-sn-glycerol-3-phosphate acyltransferase
MRTSPAGRTGVPENRTSVLRAGLAAKGAARRRDDPIAARSAFLVSLFCRYVRRDMRRRFHALRLAHADPPVLPSGRPAIVYSNHPSWWDPAVFFVLHQRCFPARAGYGPMDADALQRYALLRRLGVFGVDSGARGAARFLGIAARVLEDPANVLWVTAEGAFTDVRKRPVRLRPGIAHLARQFPGVMLVPLALEYTFWNESKPEALVRFGRPMTADAGLSATDWTHRLEAALTEAMDALAAAAMMRDPALFERLTRSTVGIGGPYDLWRRLRAAAAGRRFDPSHEGEGT